MQTFLMTLAIIGIALIGMAIGVIVSNRALKGSCGGLGRVIGEECGFCGRKDECEEAKAKLCKDDHKHNHQASVITQG
jgi:hypothetical protein